MLRISKEKIIRILAEMDLDIDDKRIETVVGVVNNFAMLKKKDLNTDEIKSIILQYINE